MFLIDSIELNSNMVGFEESYKSLLQNEKLPRVPETACALCASSQKRWSWRLICSRLIIAFACFVFGANILQRSIRHVRNSPAQVQLAVTTGTPAVPDWSEISPSEKLVWRPCFGAFGSNIQCARLTVPMDYHRPLNESAANPKVHIALVLVPGKNRTSDPASYAESPVLINPGGPGGSGAMLAAASGRRMQHVIGEHHDILGFDPRGVSATTPQADCFGSYDDPSDVSSRRFSLMERLQWVASGQAVGLANSSDVALAKIDARSRAMAKLCKRADDANGDDSIFRYSNTPNVARDMLSIVHAWDEWRSFTTVKLAKPMRVSDAVEPSKEPQTNVKSTKGKLVYWGLSYGTLLGATFASMFPDKVGRLILDGVVDADHYVEPVWMDSIRDADAIWAKFFVWCAEAGPDCPLYRIGDKPTHIKQQVDGVMSWLEKNPAIALFGKSNEPIIFTASDLKSVIFMSLYFPVTGYPGIALIFRALLDNAMDEFVSGAGNINTCNLTMLVWPDDATQAIACSDKRYKLDEDLPGLQRRFEKIASYTSFADVWIGVGSNMGCQGWEIEAKDPPMRWDDHPAHKPSPIETDFPILFLSNHLDPVTPLHAALKMTRKFVNASIVEQDGTGHCTLSCVSPCTVKYIQAYINDGVVPPVPKFESNDKGDWTTCHCEDKAWSVRHQKEALRAGESIDEVRVELNDGTLGPTVKTMEAYRQLQSQFARALVSEQLNELNPFKDFLQRSSFHEPMEQGTCGTT
ncbi:TAP-like protein-domain-containing protein [Xylariaceae sp. FL0016]|nr:TAP-like protein-domain-containing protein [Xylariaceae sp. FL0016]